MREAVTALAVLWAALGMLAPVWMGVKRSDYQESERRLKIVQTAFPIWFGLPLTFILAVLVYFAPFW